MLDIQFIRDNAELVEQSAKDKGAPVNIAELLSLDEQRRELIGRLESVREERNAVAQQMKGGKPEDTLITKGRELKEQAAELEPQLEKVEESYTALLKAVPNVPTDDTPVGSSEDDNEILRTVGDKPVFA